MLHYAALCYLALLLGCNLINVPSPPHKWRPLRLCATPVLIRFSTVEALVGVILRRGLLPVIAPLPLTRPVITVGIPCLYLKYISRAAGRPFSHMLAVQSVRCIITATLLEDCVFFLSDVCINFLGKNQSLQTRATSTMFGNLSRPGTLMDVEEGPDHLLVLVHGIWASPDDWSYFERELKKHLGKTFFIYASSCNTYTKTLTGIDDSGRRLADEVLQIVKNTRSLRKISFLAHSLGGLIARYAIGVLYKPSVPSHQPDCVDASTATRIETSCSSSYGLIASLEPFNFITLATPHLGVRGNKQLPFLLGLPFLEKIVAPIAPIFVGRTGSQLFLTDGNPNKPPLLLRMASDCDEGSFISALGAFRSRVAYANVLYDHMVGWRTSSIRRETELAKPPSQSLDGYKHVVKVEYCPPVLSEMPNFLPEAAKAKEAAQSEPSTKNTVKYHEIMEEGMICGLQRLGWTKVDVNFSSAVWRFSAHNSIHVKNERLYKAGSGVVAHVADTIKLQDPSPCLEAII